MAFEPAAALRGPGPARDRSFLQRARLDNAGLPAMTGEAEAKISILGDIVRVPATTMGQRIAKEDRPYVSNAPMPGET